MQCLCVLCSCAAQCSPTTTSSLLDLHPVWAHFISSWRAAHRCGHRPHRRVCVRRMHDGACNYYYYAVSFQLAWILSQFRKMGSYILEWIPAPPRPPIPTPAWLALLHPSGHTSNFPPGLLAHINRATTCATPAACPAATPSSTVANNPHQVRIPFRPRRRRPSSCISTLMPPPPLCHRVSHQGPLLCTLTARRGHSSPPRHALPATRPGSRRSMLSQFALLPAHPTVSPARFLLAQP